VSDGFGDLASVDALTVLAEIAVALAWFTGIVVAFRLQRPDEFLPHEYVRARYMLVVACVLLFFSLLPFLPRYFGLTESSVWIVSSVVMCVGLLTLAFVSHLNTRRDPVLSKSPWTNCYIIGSIVFLRLRSVQCVWNRSFRPWVLPRRTWMATKRRRLHGVGSFRIAPPAQNLLLALEYEYRPIQQGYGLRSQVELRRDILQYISSMPEMQAAMSTWTPDPSYGFNVFMMDIFKEIEKSRH